MTSKEENKSVPFLLKKPAISPKPVFEALGGILSGESMIIVSGKIYVRSGSRDEFLASSHEAIVKARKASGCRDFIVPADPLELERVNVYEEWESEEQLLTFRGSGPDEILSSLIESADVSRHQIVSSGPP